MSREYITHKVFLESADFHILIIEFPEEDINDKLALLAPEKGLIYKIFYEDFVLGTCMANSGPFFYHIRRRQELLSKVDDIRKEALELVYRYSPGFKPENIFINDNNVLKVRSSVDQKKGEQVRPLTDNDLWNQDPPLSHFGPATITNSPELEDDLPRNPFLDDEDEPQAPAGPNGVPIDNPFADSESPGGGGNGDGDDVPYELVGHRWKKMGVGLNVRKYEADEDSAVLLLGGTPFESTRGFHLLVVRLCIEDYSDVFHLLDTMGVTRHTSPPKIVEELYEIAVSYNPFLRLENVDLKKVRAEYKKRQRARARNRTMMAAGNDDRTVRTSKKRFSDVPAETLLNLDTELKKHIVGQDEAVELLSEAIQRASVGLKREHEPLGCLLFTGNTGVGKTETAKALSEVLDAHLVRVDCQEYQHPHEVAKLTGSPPGYIGYDDGGHLTKEVSKHPFSIVLLDEIEKAHGNFHERVLQILDDGVLTESKGGKKVSFQQCFIIMTSNIGVKEVDNLSRTVGFGDVHASTEGKTAKARKEALKKKFKPEFLNRIDEVVHFRLLSREDYTHILNILLEEVSVQLSANKGITLRLTTGAKNFLIDRGIDKKFGARPMRRAIKKYLNTPLAKSILKKEIEDNSKVNVTLSKDRESLIFKPDVAKKKSNDELQDDSAE
ncbi:MAG: AAA domain-containing protein [Candidatus Altiarchaeales archaeon]|nr:AAA domain-containing protein [Candidatus Altiarchaeales archaeon]